MLLALLLALCAAGWSTHARAEERTLSFFSVNTKESVTITYKRDGEFLPDGMKQINHIMRDWRRDEPTDMDPELIDLIWNLHRELGSQEPIHLISGYRSQATNNKLRRTKGGQARKSQHILGKAADIHFPDVSVKALRNSALVREVGGVGYYPKSGIPFVHVDTGRVRHWPRVPRMELAALFPDGKTLHRPRDGKPITLADSRRAIKSGKYAGPPVMMASAKKPETRTAPVVTASLKKPETRTAPVVTASLTPGTLTDFMKTMGITGSVSKTTAPKPASQAPATVHMASASPTAALPASPAVTAPAPLPAVVNLEDQPDYDPEHPELAYRPFSVLPLMGEAPISHGQSAAVLVAPSLDNTDYLLKTPNARVVLASARRAGGRTAALGLRNGLYTEDLAAEPPAPQKARALASARSGSTPVTGGFTAGFSGGSSSGFGFR